MANTGDSRLNVSGSQCELASADSRDRCCALPMSNAGGGARPRLLPMTNAIRLVATAAKRKTPAIRGKATSPISFLCTTC